MQSRHAFLASACRRVALLSCVLVATTALTGCLSTWKFHPNDLKIKLVAVGDFAGIYDLPYRADPGDTITVCNHVGKKVRLVFPAGTVTAQDEDPRDSNIQVTVKKWRRKKITIDSDPPLTQDPFNNGVIQMKIDDPDHGGATIIIQPAN